MGKEARAASSTSIIDSAALIWLSCGRGTARVLVSVSGLMRQAELRLTQGAHGSTPLKLHCNLWVIEKKGACTT